MPGSVRGLFLAAFLPVFHVCSFSVYLPRRLVARATLVQVTLLGLFRRLLELWWGSSRSSASDSPATTWWTMAQDRSSPVTDLEDARDTLDGGAVSNPASPRCDTFTCSNRRNFSPVIAKPILCRGTCGSVVSGATAAAVCDGSPCFSAARSNLDPDANDELSLGGSKRQHAPSSDTPSYANITAPAVGQSTAQSLASASPNATQGADWAEPLSNGTCAGPDSPRSSPCTPLEAMRKPTVPQPVIPSEHTSPLSPSPLQLEVASTGSAVPVCALHPKSAAATPGPTEGKQSALVDKDWSLATPRTERRVIGSSVSSTVQETRVDQRSSSAAWLALLNNDDSAGTVPNAQASLQTPASAAELRTPKGTPLTRGSASSGSSLGLSPDFSPHLPLPSVSLLSRDTPCVGCDGNTPLAPGLFLAAITNGDDGATPQPSRSGTLPQQRPQTVEKMPLRLSNAANISSAIAVTPLGRGNASGVDVGVRADPAMMDTGSAIGPPRPVSARRRLSVPLKTPMSTATEFGSPASRLIAAQSTSSVKGRTSMGGVESVTPGSASQPRYLQPTQSWAKKHG